MLGNLRGLLHPIRLILWCRRDYFPYYIIARIRNIRNSKAHCIVLMTSNRLARLRVVKIFYTWGIGTRGR